MTIYKISEFQRSGATIALVENGELGRVGQRHERVHQIFDDFRGHFCRQGDEELWLRDGDLLRRLCDGRELPADVGRTLRRTPIRRRFPKELSLQGPGTTDTIKLVDCPN